MTIPCMPPEIHHHSPSFPSGKAEKLMIIQSTLFAPPTPEPTQYTVMEWTPWCGIPLTLTLYTPEITAYLPIQWPAPKHFTHPLWSPPSNGPATFANVTHWEYQNGYALPCRQRIVSQGTNILSYSSSTPDLTTQIQPHPSYIPRKVTKLPDIAPTASLQEAGQALINHTIICELHRLDSFFDHYTTAPWLLSEIFWTPDGFTILSTEGYFLKVTGLIAHGWRNNKTHWLWDYQTSEGHAWSVIFRHY